MPKVTAISLSAPAAAKNNPSATPELLASILARYSRSNEGIQGIFSKVDPNNCEASVDRILKFADYGHASIGGLTGGIAVAIDNLSMYSAYRLFEFSPMADGQESSTRYISLDETGLPDPVALGFSPETAPQVTALWKKGLSLYHKTYKLLDEAATKNPSIVRYPANAKPVVIDRIRKNYALDRARYFLPFSMSTSLALVQSARMWAETLCGLYALGASGQTEATVLADSLKAELHKYCPRLIKHARAKPAWVRTIQEEVLESKGYSPSIKSSLNHHPVVKILNSEDDPLLDAKLAHDISGRENRYDRCGKSARTTAISVTWKELPIAELRDLNRHRTGGRNSSLDHQGFYLPPEVLALAEADLELKTELESFLTCMDAVSLVCPAHLTSYIRFLGSITKFSHTTTVDKYVYTAELRTGLGAHFLYAEKYKESVMALAESGYPLTAQNINLGTAEPE
jgi:thymidylate synthase ThyX